MIRWLGFLLIVCGTSAIGIQMAGGVHRAVRFFQDMQTALDRMSREISYHLTPLAQLTQTVAQDLTEPVNALISAFGSRLLSAPEEPMQMHMLEAMKSCGAAVPQEARRILMTLSGSLGRQDVSAQVSALETASREIEAVRKDYENRQKTQCRSYETLGVCAGLAVAILFI